MFNWKFRKFVYQNLICHLSEIWKWKHGPLSTTSSFIIKEFYISQLQRPASLLIIVVRLCKIIFHWPNSLPITIRNLHIPHTILISGFKEDYFTAYGFHIVQMCNSLFYESSLNMFDLFGFIVYNVHCTRYTKWISHINQTKSIQCATN